MNWTKKRHMQLKKKEICKYFLRIYINCYYYGQRIWKKKDDVMYVQFLPRHEYKEAINIINNERGHNDK